MIRSLTTTALVGACFAVATSHAAEVTFSGSVDAGTLISFDSLENAPAYGHNLEANLTADIKLSDAVSAQLYGAALAGDVPTVVKQKGAAGRWPTYNFDGAAITWKLGEDKTLVFGDIVVGRGTIGYYALKRFTSGARTQAVKGVSYTASGFNVYVGNPDISDDVTAFGAGYSATLAEGITLDPFVDVTTGISQNLPWTAGAQFKGAFGPLSLALTGTAFGADNNAVGAIAEETDSTDADTTYLPAKHAIGYAIVAEPNLTFGSVTWANTLVFAPKAEAMGKGEYPEYSFPIRHGRSYDAIPYDLMFYTEPGYAFSDVVAAGLAIEYMEADLSTEKNETILVTPNLYLYPTTGASVTIYAGATMLTADDATTTYFGGLETVFKF